MYRIRTKASGHALSILFHLCMDHTVMSDIYILEIVQDTIEALIRNVKDNKKLASVVSLVNRENPHISNLAEVERDHPLTSHTHYEPYATTQPNLFATNKIPSHNLLPTTPGTVLPSASNTPGRTSRQSRTTEYNPYTSSQIAGLSRYEKNRLHVSCSSPDAARHSHRPWPIDCPLPTTQQSYYLRPRWVLASHRAGPSVLRGKGVQQRS